MATLTPLVPIGDVSSATMLAPVGASTYWQALDDYAGGSTTNDGDTTYATPGLDSGGTLTLDISAMPTDFASMDTLTITCAARLNGTRNDDNTSLFAQVIAADGTLLTNEVIVSTQATSSVYTNDTATFTTINQPTNKALWDTAQIRLRWTFAKSKGSDGIAIRITAVRLNGTYTAMGPPTVVPLWRIWGLSGPNIQYQLKDTPTVTSFDVELNGVLLLSSVAAGYYAINATPGTEYTFRIRGRNSAGPGPWLTRTVWTPSELQVEFNTPPTAAVMGPIKVRYRVSELNGDGKLNMRLIQSNGAILESWTENSIASTPTTYEKTLALNSLPSYTSLRVGMSPTFGSPDDIGTRHFTVYWTEVEVPVSGFVPEVPQVTGLTVDTTVNPDGSGQFDANWNAVAGAGSYRIYNYSGGGAYTLLGTSVTTNFVYDGSEEDQYSFAVTAVEGDFEGPYSETVTAVIPIYVAGAAFAAFGIPL